MLCQILDRDLMKERKMLNVFSLKELLRLWKITQKNISRILKICIFDNSVTLYLEDSQSIILKMSV